MFEVDYSVRSSNVSMSLPYHIPITSLFFSVTVREADEGLGEEIILWYVFRHSIACILGPFGEVCRDRSGGLISPIRTATCNLFAPRSACPHSWPLKDRRQR